LKPGFCDTTEGFSIDPYTLDEDNWTEGYVTVRNSGNSETGGTFPIPDAGQE